MNSQKQDQSRQQQQIIGSNNQQFNSSSILLNGQGPHAALLQNQQMLLSQPLPQQQQQQQMLSNSQKNNNNSKSFTNFLSGVNDLQSQQNQLQSALLQQQQTQNQQQASSPQQAKGLQISAFTIKINEGKLKLVNSVDLRPFVQVQFGKRIWRTQTKKDAYPKWNEEKRFEVFVNKGFDLNNPSGICSTSTTTQSSCSSISPQPSQNQQMQIFQQQQLLNGSHPGGAGGQVDWNIEIVVLHKSQNEEIELGRTNLNVEEQQMQIPKWVIIENNNVIIGQIQVQFQFEYINYQLQMNKNSHQIFLNSKQQQKQQQQQITYPQYNYFKGVVDDGQSSKQQQQSSNVNSTTVTSLNHTPLIGTNKRNPSSHSETSSFQDFQFIPQTSSRVVSMNQNYQDIPESISKLQMSYSTHVSNPNGNNSNAPVGFQFRQYDMVELINQLKQEKDFLLTKDRILQDRFSQVQVESTTIAKEQSKLEQQQNNIKMQEVLLRQKQQGLEQQKDDFEKKIGKLEDSKKILQSYIQEYQNLVAEEQEIIKGNSKIRSDINLMSEEEPQVQDALSILQKKNNSEILQLKIFKLRMINHLKEINSIFYNRKPTTLQKGLLRGHHQRAKSYSNHVSFGVDTVTSYTVALKNLQNKISDLTDVINTKNYEIESLRDQIIKIQSNYDDN